MISKGNLDIGIVFCMVLVFACSAGAGCIDSVGSGPVEVLDTAMNDSVAISPVPTENPGSSSSVSIQQSNTTTKLPAVSSGSGAILSQPTVVQGGYVKVTLTAPYGDYHVSVSPSGIIPHGQIGVDTQTPPYTQNYAKIHVDVSGELTFTVKSVSTEDIKIRLLD